MPALEGLGAGIIWGVGNILLVAAIVLCGLAVGLKIAIGLSLILGVILTFTVDPAATNHPWLLAAGVVVLALAIAANGSAYKVREASLPVAGANVCTVRGWHCVAVSGFLMSWRVVAKPTRQLLII